MRLHAWALSDVGRKRDHNEDSFLVRADLGLFAVADGMGGHLGGADASRMAIRVLERELQGGDVERAIVLPEGRETGAEDTQPMEIGAPALLRQAARAAGASIYRAAQQNPQLNGMGTTLTALLVHREKVYVAHVGDSRAYLLRDGRCAQVTEDHSWIHEQVKAGLLSEAEARESRFKHIITRSVGFERDVQVDVASFPATAGDCYVLCSDGLSNHVDAVEIERVLASTWYRRAPRVLVDLANDRGGDDNITVLVVYLANDATPVAMPPRAQAAPRRRRTTTRPILRDPSLPPDEAPPTRATPRRRAPRTRRPR